MKHERIEALVSGRVQMVLFRDFAQRKAKGLKLVGEVRNRKDGTVAIVAEGPRPMLDSYIKKLRHGPMLAKVERVETTWLKAEGKFNTFSIQYD